jgi:hypothetical protein
MNIPGPRVTSGPLILRFTHNIREYSSTLSTAITLSAEEK